MTETTRALVLAGVLFVVALILVGAWLYDRHRARRELEQAREDTDAYLAALRASSLTGVPVPVIEERIARTGESPLTAAAMIAEAQRLAFVWAVADARVRLLGQHPELARLLDPDRPPRPRNPRG